MKLSSTTLYPAAWYHHNWLTSRKDHISTIIAWTPEKVDKLEAALATARADGEDSIVWRDEAKPEGVRITCTYGKYLVDFLNAELTTPLASRWQGH